MSLIRVFILDEIETRSMMIPTFGAADTAGVLREIVARIEQIRHRTHPYRYQRPAIDRRPYWETHPRPKPPALRPYWEQQQFTTNC